MGDVERVAAEFVGERHRQISDEGWSPQHDDAHRNGEMAGAAACYAMHGLKIGSDRLRLDVAGMVYRLWPWARHWWKPKDRRRDLVRAGALLIAEVQRLDRAAAIKRITDS